MFATGLGLTVTVKFEVEGHKPEALVAVKVYTVVVAGLAIGFEIFVALSPVAGDHVYSVPPEPVNCVLCPLHRVIAEPALALIAAGFPITAVPDIVP